MVGTIRWSFCRKRRTLPCGWTTATPAPWSMRVSTNTCDWALRSLSAGCLATLRKRLPGNGNSATPPVSVDASKVKIKKTKKKWFKNVLGLTFKRPFALWSSPPVELWINGKLTDYAQAATKQNRIIPGGPSTDSDEMAVEVVKPKGNHNGKKDSAQREVKDSAAQSPSYVYKTTKMSFSDGNLVFTIQFFVVLFRWTH